MDFNHLSPDCVITESLDIEDHKVQADGGSKIKQFLNQRGDHQALRVHTGWCHGGGPALGTEAPLLGSWGEWGYVTYRLQCVPHAVKHSLEKSVFCWKFMMKKCPPKKIFCSAHDLRP